ncbi:MAG: HAD hydrolase-like protein [Clostridia bacterium]|nr:HAD hydrolase-like protein [Clostridia bacterium]
MCKLKTEYKILALDHDDTTVHSTPEVNWPAFQETLSLLRPDVRYSYDEFMELCYEPGFDDLCRKILKFNEDEMVIEVNTWQKYVKSTVPSPVEGLKSIIEKQFGAGGKICVVSHSYAANIERDWKIHFGCVPDVIYAWDDNPLKRKPSPWPLEDMAARFGCSTSDILVVDDLKPGYDMAMAAGSAFAFAGWAAAAASTKKTMRRLAVHYLETPENLEDILFNG